MSNTYVPLKRSERLHDALCKKYAKENKRQMLLVKMIMNKKMIYAKMKEKIECLTKILEIFIKTFNCMLFYGIDDSCENPEKVISKMFKNVYFKTFIWMREAGKQPEGQRVLGKQVEKFRKMYKSYRNAKIGVIQNAFRLTDDLMDVIDSYA
jgi:hypothetical protein